MRDIERQFCAWSFPHDAAHVPARECIHRDAVHADDLVPFRDARLRGRSTRMHGRDGEGLGCLLVETHARAPERDGL